MIVPFDKNGRAPNASTFGSDNIEALIPWLTFQTAKVASGSIEVLSFIIRVFDPTETVETVGPKGRVTLPIKDLYMFRYSGNEVIGFDEAVTKELHCLDPQTFEMGPPEPGIRYASGKAVIASLQEDGRHP
jgi:hypothetical protein